MKTGEFTTYNIKRCSRCILPETFPGIRFDQEGICNYCHSWESIQVRGEKSLEAVLNQYKGKGNEFDCLVPLSGGRDSAYVLHQMVKKYGMRVLAITVDSGYILPEGITNIKNCTSALNVPHIWIRDEKRNSISVRNTNIKFLGWLKHPSINAIVPVLNASDKTMNLQMYRYAHRHHIPLVVGGNNIGNSSFEQEYWKTGFMGVFPDNRGYYSPANKIKLIFLLTIQYLTSPYNYHLSILKEYIEGGMVYFFESILKPRDVHSLGFYDYIYWNEQSIIETITRELNWQGASDATTTWRIDDSAYPIINYIYLKLVGFTEHDEMYSRMTREGQISRDIAIERCMADHKSQWINGPRLEGLLKDMGVTKEELDTVLEKYSMKLKKRGYKP